MLERESRERSIGDCTRISTAAIVEHGVGIGKLCYMGAASVVTENTVITDNTVVKNVTVYCG